MTRGDLLAATPEESCLQGELNEALAEIGRLRKQLADEETAIGLASSLLEAGLPELARWRLKEYLSLKAQKEKK